MKNLANFSGGNKVVLVTGSSKGIGRTIAEEFGKDGWQVALNGRSETNDLKETCAAINKTGSTANVFPGDVGIKKEVDSIVEDVINKWGKIDVLINNAGIIHENLLINTDEETWDRVINTNLKGIFLCTKAVSRPMMKVRTGSVISIGSIQGLRGGYGTAAYASSKGGLISFTKSAAQELGKRGITVNAVFPGYQKTGMENDAYDKDARQESVLGVTTDLQEVVTFIVMLAQMKSVSGQVFNWDSRIL